jgi:hypothetical protein
MNLQDVTTRDALDVLMADLGRQYQHTRGATNTLLYAAVVANTPRSSSTQAGRFGGQGPQVQGFTYTVVVAVEDMDKLLQGDMLVDQRPAGRKFRVVGTPFTPEGGGHAQADAVLAT